MSAPTDAIRKTIVVRCSMSTAFRIWTEQIDLWWPKGHSRSGDPRTTVLLEQYVGGRLYERTPNGVEYVWGVVLVWEPPQRFAYHWHLGSGPAQPTRVDVSFTALDSAQTRVEVLHRGPELIGERWWQSSPRFDAAWEHVLPAYLAVCAIAIGAD